MQLFGSALALATAVLPLVAAQDKSAEFLPESQISLVRERLFPVAFSPRSRSVRSCASASPGGSATAKMFPSELCTTRSTRSFRISSTALRKESICSRRCRCRKRRPMTAASPVDMPNTYGEPI